MESDSSLKHLVIVGASFAGVSLCLNVGSAFKITLIDRKEFYEWVTAIPKSIVNRSGYFDEQATIDYNEMVNVNKVLGPNVTFVQADLTELVDESTIKIKRITDGKASKEEELNFDYLTLCTGAIYSINGAAEDIAKIYTKKERSTLFENYREQIEQAESVLVVGGGPTGLEMVGELLMRFGESKTIGIANSGAHLLTGFPENASTAAEEYLEGKGVKLHLNTKYDPKGDIAKKYDFAIKWVGQTFYTPYLDANFKDFKDKRGRVFVNEYFQITNVNPWEAPGSDAPEPKTLKNIFWYGDAALTRMDEVKVVPSISQTVSIVANNLKESLNDSPKYTEMDYGVSVLASVYFGEDKGVSVANTFAEVKDDTLNFK